VDQIEHRLFLYIATSWRALRACGLKVMNKSIPAADAPEPEPVFRTIRTVATAPDVPHLAAALQRAARDLTGAQEVTFVLRQDDAVAEIGIRATAADVSTERVPLATDLARMVLERGEPIVIADSAHAEQLFPGASRLMPTGSIAVVPVHRHAVTGALVAYWSAPFVAGAHLEPLSTLAATAGLTLANIELLERVRESDARFRLMADTSPVMIWATDAAGSIEFVNRAYCDFFGVREADVQGPDGWQPLVHPDDVSHYTGRFLESLRTGTPFFAEARVRRADGQWRWIASYAAPRLSADGRLVGAVGSSPDITERKEAELALKISEQRLRTIMDSTPALVYIVDVDQRFVLVNHEFDRLFCADHRTVSGRPVHDCFPRQTADQFTTHNRQVLAAGSASQFEEVVVHEDGVHHYISVKAPLFDEANRPVGICGVSTDITQQKRLLSALEVAQRAKDAFVATVAHELRQPLGAIQAALGVMRVRPDRSAGERARETVERQVTQLARLVDDLLDAARIAQGKVPIRRERLTLNRVLDGAVAVVMPAVEHAGQTLNVSIPNDPVWVDGDATRLQQVFSNLLTNASKFTDRRGQVSLGVDVTADTVVVRVSDNGRGMAADALPHVFDLFAQANADERGLGIGLSVVRGLVLQHGGTVEARSGGIGLGSEFTVRLPLADSPENEVAPAG
jgi:PAS domain S-box-containing protein